MWMALSYSFRFPKHISEQKVIEAIDYRKDVDGFHPINVGRMSIGLPCFIIGYACRYLGIIEALSYRDARKALRGFGTQQYCRQADGYL